MSFDVIIMLLIMAKQDATLLNQSTADTLLSSCQPQQAPRFPTHAEHATSSKLSEIPSAEGPNLPTVVITRGTVVAPQHASDPWLARSP